MELTVAVVLFVGAAALWFGLSRPTKPPPQRTSPTEDGPDRQYAHLKGDGKFSVEVVGESHYRDNLIRITRSHWHDTSGDDLDCLATLHLDDANPHDPQAVQVRINGLQVGNLSREMARDFRQAIKRDGISSHREFAVTAKVWIPDDPREDHFSVSLDLPLAP